MSKSSGDQEWGEEVMAGVYMFKRGRHANQEQYLAELASRYGVDTGGAGGLTINMQQIHEDIEKMELLLSRLEESNAYMIQYLAEHGSAVNDNKGIPGEAASAPRIEPATTAGAPSQGSDGDDDDDLQAVRDAVLENEQLKLEKKRELAELKALTAMHTCAHSKFTVTPAQQQQQQLQEQPADSVDSAAEEHVEVVDEGDGGMGGMSRHIDL